MVNNYDKHVDLRKRNLKDLGLGVENVSEETKEIIYTDNHPFRLEGKDDEDIWED